MMPMPGAPARCARRSGLCLVACLVSIPLAAPAQAQNAAPSITCRINDTNVALDLMQPLSRDGSGNAARGMRGSLTIHHQKVTRDRRRWELDDKLPAQFWNWGNEVKIRLLLATGDQLLDLVIEAQRRQDSSDHRGTFRLETSEGVKVQGRVECLVG